MAAAHHLSMSDQSPGGTHMSNLSPSGTLMFLPGLWAVTGSSMALFWLELGRLPPNGISPMLHCRVLDLPSIHDKAAMTLILEDLQRRACFPLSSSDQLTLLDWAENAAIMDFAFKEFHKSPSGSNMSAVLGIVSTGKLMVEVRQPIQNFVNLELTSIHA